MSFVAHRVLVISVQLKVLSRSNHLIQRLISKTEIMPIHSKDSATELLLSSHVLLALAGSSHGHCQAETW